MNINSISSYSQHSVIDEQSFQDMVATCAYLKFAERGFTEGYALQDWLEAEQEITVRCFYWLQDVD